MAGEHEQAEDRVAPEEIVGEIDCGPDAGSPDVPASNLGEGAQAGDKINFKAQPIGWAGEVADGLEVLAEEHVGGSLADEAGEGLVGGEHARSGDFRAHPGVAEVDGGADLREEVELLGADEGVIKFIGGQAAEKSCHVGEALEVGEGVDDAVRSDVEELVYP